MDHSIEQRTISKLSWRLLPLMGVSYLMSYIDRANVSFAALQMNADLGFSATVYGLGAGLFFVAYALFEVPSNLIMPRFGPRRWIARIMLTWGVISMAMAFVRTAEQFYVARFLLGMAEAGFFPGILHYLSQWFPSNWRGRAVSRFYIAVPLASVVMGGLAGALLGLDGTLGLAGWQWLFLIEGAPSLLLAGLLLRFLPDHPSTATWLTDAERDWLTTQLDADKNMQVADHPSIWRAIFNPHIFLLGLTMGLAFACLTAVTFSGPALLQKVSGWSTGYVGGFVALCGLFTAALMLVMCAYSDHKGERYTATFLMLALTLMSALVMAYMGGFGPTILGYAGFTAGAIIVGPLCHIMNSEMLSEAARPVGLAAVNTVGQIGNFFGPVVWGVLTDQTGSFDAALRVIPGMVLLSGVVLAAHAWRYRLRSPDAPKLVID